jgi:ectoine hydroxylase-related dioxygenase (phytanoyl-CoA dioxygenase family)
MHALPSNNVFIDLLHHLIFVGLIGGLKDSYFGSNCILNSLSALDNIPNHPSFSSVVHRDLRFYSHGLPTMLNCLLMVDDFTLDNGGTYLLAGSHLAERRPTDEEFFGSAIETTGKAGDILVCN